MSREKTGGVRLEKMLRGGANQEALSLDRHIQSVRERHCRNNQSKDRQ